MDASYSVSTGFMLFLQIFMIVIMNSNDAARKTF